ncbi:MAG TPA: CsbD family protein, partial [Magnetospirillum sp.]|nr:CsbD family protein [Magnetospirillum sp.]
WDQVKGNWTEFRGKVKEQWGELTDDDLDRMAGQRDQLIGQIQKRYGTTREEAERRVREWEGTVH